MIIGCDLKLGKKTFWLEGESGERMRVQETSLEKKRGGEEPTIIKLKKKIQNGGMMFGK